MDAKTFYEQLAPELDPGGFKLYFTAQRLTGFELYKQFPYEDSRGRSYLEPATNGLSFSLSTTPHRHIGHLSKSCTQQYCKTTI